ncbi:MAG: adenosylcobinamide kinase / adenosylcobinamide-phosphate guanylyltransferase [Clostridiales bacterium]|nr:adenosylcobinamide kinase / adenosylcobinamide-phosphate guanylyltransferase [Clostridiales bacterium]MDK2992274.1 adenosylcobinamide kinase / adenosylcobinamide-phosphate guanylyltransferase [Clostridiales bacterium]
MGRVTFITGGARSGKSAFAERLARQYGDDVAYIATSIATDAEMEERIRLHRLRRPAGWTTYESYKGIGDIINGTDKSVVLLDCITIMITNLMLEYDIDWDHCTVEQIDAVEHAIRAEIKIMLDAAKGGKADLIIVSNEVGMGLVPDYPLGRIFRDIAGRVNQLIAAQADEVYFIVSGIPLKLKTSGTGGL